MNSRPKFSVVTINYNQGRYLADNIESVLTQNYPNFEHIIVDGGSTDNTKEVCSKYIHVKFIYAPGTNQTEALNIGFKIAKGDIIAWLNSDDYYEPQTFAKIAELLSGDNSPPAITGGAKVVNSDKSFMWMLPAEPVQFYRLLFHPRLYKVKGKTCMPCQPATFFHKKIMDKLGPLIEKYHYGMDYEYWLRMLFAGYPIHHVPDVFANYRHHLKSKTVQKGYDEFLPEWHEISCNYRNKLSVPRKILGECIWITFWIESVFFRQHNKALKILNGLRVSDRKNIPLPKQITTILRVLTLAPWLAGNIIVHIAKGFFRNKNIFKEDGSVAK